jgi:hyaluronan synthase
MTLSTELLARVAPRVIADARYGEPAPVPAGERAVRVLAVLTVAVICGVIAWHVSLKVRFLHLSTPTGIYTVLISSYVLSRFVLAAFYRPPKDAGLEPNVAIVVPAYNEGSAVARTIHSCLALDYPRDKLEVVVVDDGSTDDTLDQMMAAAAHYPGGAVRCIDLGSNQGKRAAMAAGIRATTAEILVFVDSDSMPAPRAVRRLVQGFADHRVGAISGLTYVRNASTNALTKMQAARYYVSFQLLKAAESVLGAVACCSGCFAAYRRAAVVDLLEGWEHQRFLGTECTYGDDRALTNQVLRARWITLYDSRAEAWTDAPDQYRKFFRQQLRWKKSWAREGPILAAHLWRTRPRAFPSVIVQTLAGLLSPIVLFWNLSKPLTSAVIPVIYLLGLYLVSMAYGLLYRAHRNEGLWRWAFLGTFFYIAFSPQILWAMLRIRDGKWGTRDATAPASAEKVSAVA